MENIEAEKELVLTDEQAEELKKALSKLNMAGASLSGKQVYKVGGRSFIAEEMEDTLHEQILKERGYSSMLPDRKTRKKIIRDGKQLRKSS